MIKQHQLILSLLRENARISLTEVAKKTHVPVSTLHEMVKNNFKGSITKKTILLNFDKVGFPARANLLLKVNKDQKEEIKDYLKANPHTNTMHSVSNGFDFSAEFVFRDFKEMEIFFEELDEKFDIIDKKKCYIMEELKREGFMASYDYLKLGCENAKL